MSDEHSIIRKPKNVVITVEPQHEVMCREFADAMCDDGKANDRYEQKGHSRNVLWRNHYEGKMSEFAVYQWLRDSGQNPSVPDTLIWTEAERPQKALDEPDIVTEKNDMHIKSTSDYMTKKLGGRKSWSFRKEDPIVDHPTERDIVVGCTVLEDSNIRIDFLARADKLTPYYEAPVYDTYKDSKYCLYWNTIKFC